MTTLLEPPTENPAEPPVAVDATASEASSDTQLIRIFANLLPDEVIASRGLAVLKRRLLLAMILLIVLLGAGYAYSWLQTNQADDDLSSEQSISSGLQTQLQQYSPLVEVQGKIATIQTQLQGAMANDVRWTNLINSLTAATPGKLTVSSLNATVVSPTDAGAASSQVNPLNNTGLQVVGTMTLDGTTPDYRSVAAYADALAKIKGIAVVDPGLVSGDPGALTYTITVSLTTAVLGGRFTPPASAPASASTPPVVK